MHIAVNLGVQKIASFQVDNFLQEEVDYELNIAMDRFIKQRYHPLSNRFRKGFEQSQKRIDDLRHLVVTATVNTFSAGGIAELGDDEFYFADRAALPNDYLFLVSVRAQVLDACQPTIASLLNTEFAFQRIDLTPPVAGYILTNIWMDPSGGGLVQIASNVDGLTKDQLLDPQTYVQVSPVPAVSVEDINVSIIEQTPTADGNELFLKLGTDVNPNYNAYNTTLFWTHPVDETVQQVVMETPQIITQSRRTITPQTIRLSSCTYSQLDDIYTLLDDPFNTTKSTSPLYTIEENFVDVYSNNEFVTNSVRLKYIRRPQRMSKSLGVGCELPEHTHQEIVEMAIKSILEGIQDPRYQSQSAETAESE